jgi:hypothetical protein
MTSTPRCPAATTDDLVWSYLCELARWWLEASEHRRYPVRDVVGQALVDLGDMRQRLSQGVLL